MTQQAESGPKWKWIRDDLRTEIENGTYPPGSQLPTKQELMARYNVAVNTVARAIDELRRARLVVTVQGAGMYVADVLPGETVDDPAARTALLEEQVKALREKASGQDELLAGVVREVREHGRLLARISQRLERAGVTLADPDRRNEQAV